MSEPRTLGELRRNYSGTKTSVKEEMRRNLLRKLATGESLFPGVLGYDDSVVPQLVNAVLSKHNMILLGLRGQAKSRLLRSLTTLLDPAAPMVAGCEIHDDPFRPQPRLDRDNENGMTTTVGRLREEPVLGGIKYVLVSHNTRMGAAQGAMLIAEYLAKQGYIG